MGRFNNPAAQREEAADNSSLFTPHSLSDEDEGIHVDLPFRPTSKVWYITDRGPRSERVIRVRTDHRSLTSTTYSPVDTATVVMESGTERNAEECFTTYEKLEAWLKTQAEKQK